MGKFCNVLTFFYCFYSDTVQSRQAGFVRCCPMFYSRLPMYKYREAATELSYMSEAFSVAFTVA